MILDDARVRATRAVGAARRIAGNVAETNRVLAHVVGHDVLELAHHPVRAAKHLGRNLVYPVRHPVRTVKHLASEIRRDPLDGGLDAAGVATGVAYLGLVGVAAGATVLAPFTGGASLVVAAHALGFADAMTGPFLAIDGAAVALHEARGAIAPTREKARAEAGEIAPWLEDLALLGVGTAVGNAVEARFPAVPDAGPPEPGGMAGWVVNDGIGLAGVYDSPQDLGAPSRHRPR